MVWESFRKYKKGLGKGDIVTNSVWRECRKRAVLVTGLLISTASVVSLGNTLELLGKIPHSGYSEGLDFYEGFLWNALPQQILKIDPQDGTIVQRYSPASDYSESIKWIAGVLWNLSFSDNGLYRGKLTKSGFQFEKGLSLSEAHGWGIEKVGSELIVTGNFSNKLYFYDLGNLKLKKTLATEGVDLEDLAWDGRRLWTSSYTTQSGKIFSINLKSGKVDEIWQLPDADQCPVIDGIAFDGNSLWITGKECPSIYRVKIPSTRSLSSKNPKK